METCRPYIKDDQIEEDHQGMYDKANDVFQLAHHSLGVLQGKGQVLTLLHPQASTVINALANATG